MAIIKNNMSGENKSQGELDNYFNSPRFLRRLNNIRSQIRDARDLKAIAMDIQFKLNLKFTHISVVYYYLLTGEYEPSKQKSAIEIVDRSLPKNKPLVEIKDGIEISYDIEDIGVAIELTEDTNIKDLRNFIDKNWEAIQSALDNNYSQERIYRFVAPKNIDKYLAVAEELFIFDAAKPTKKQRSEKIADLASEYEMEIPDVSKYARKYRTFFQSI